MLFHVLEALEGGTARHVTDIVRHVRTVRHEVAVPSNRVGWVTDEAAEAVMSAAGAQVHLVEMRRDPWHPRNAAAVVRLRRLIVASGATVVHGHSSVGGALARVASLGLGVARVYTPNGLAVSRAALAIERVLASATDCFVAVSPSEAKVALQRGLAGPERLAVIPNGVELGSASFGPSPAPDLRARLGIDSGTPLVGCVARLVPQKAPEVFVRVCAQVARERADVQFVLIGSGSQQSLVDREVARVALGGRFHHLRRLPEASGVLSQLNVYVLASRFEGAPYTPLEAMRAGTPVVLSDVTGNQDVVESGVSGILCPPADISSMARAVLGLLDASPAREAMVAAARQRLAERFDVRAMGEALGRLYVELAAAGGGSCRGA